ncbi:MAG: hypothetical protein ABIK98_12010 [Pseudomonadota bacterium]
MFDASSIPIAIAAITAINAAVRNIRLYPADSAQINNSIAKAYQSLETKLRSYCLDREKTAELLRQKGMDRRQQRRIAIDGRVMVRICNASGTVTSANHLSANTYSIHVRFDRSLDQTFIDANDVLSWEFDL